MRDLDKLRSEKDLEGKVRTFKLIGRTFTAKPILGAREFSSLADVINAMAEGRVVEGTFEQLSNTIRDSLIPECRDMWDEVLALDLEVPIDLNVLYELAQDLIATEAERPTVPPSSSGSMGESGSTTSTDDSDFKADRGLKNSPSVPV